MDWSKIFAVLVVGAAVTTLGYYAPVADNESTDELDETKLEQLIHQEINRHRASHNESRLDYDNDLGDIAQSHSSDMVDREYFAHESPEGDGFQSRYNDAGYACQKSIGGDRTVPGGENIAQLPYRENVETAEGVEYYENESELAEAVVSDWMSSEAHRENILQPYWDVHGIGVAINDEDMVFVTQNFC